jgi:hypothetical protein
MSLRVVGAVVGDDDVDDGARDEDRMVSVTGAANDDDGSDDGVDDVADATFVLPAGAIGRAVGDALFRAPFRPVAEWTSGAFEFVPRAAEERAPSACAFVANAIAATATNAVARRAIDVVVDADAAVPLRRTEGEGYKTHALRRSRQTRDGMCFAREDARPHWGFVAPAPRGSLARDAKRAATRKGIAFAFGSLHPTTTARPRPPKRAVRGRSSKP